MLPVFADVVAASGRLEGRVIHTPVMSSERFDARVGRNPRTGETVNVEEKHVPFFKTGKLLRDRLNGKS